MYTAALCSQFQGCQDSNTSLMALRFGFKTRLLHSQPRNWVAKCKAGWIGEVNETLLLLGQAS